MTTPDTEPGFGLGHPDPPARLPDAGGVYAYTPASGRRAAKLEAVAAIEGAAEPTDPDEHSPEVPAEEPADPPA
jgi:hypothetical protein